MADKSLLPKAVIDGWQIIKKTLQENHLSEQQIRLATTAWVKLYNEHPGFDPALISARLSAILGNTMSEEEFRVALSFKAAMVGGHSESDDLEAEYRPSSPSRTVALEQKKDAEKVVFNALLEDIMARLLDQVSLADFSDDLVADRNTLGLEREATIELERWLATLGQSFHKNNMRMTLKDMRSFTHHLYVWSCEEIGPSEADQLFADALRAVEMLPDARQYSPKQFF